MNYVTSYVRLLSLYQTLIISYWYEEVTSEEFHMGATISHQRSKHCGVCSAERITYPQFKDSTEMEVMNVLIFYNVIV